MMSITHHTFVARLSHREGEAVRFIFSGGIRTYWSTVQTVQVLRFEVLAYGTICRLRTLRRPVEHTGTRTARGDM